MPRRATSENVVRFTKSAVAALALAPGQSERVVWDQEVRGFGVRLRDSGNRSWVIRPPRTGGKSILHTIAAVDALDLASARRTAQERLAGAALGDDPNKARREARAQAAVTLGSLVGAYIADQEKRLRASTLGHLRNHLNVHWKPLHSRPLNGITRAEVAERHRVLAAENGPHSADRARAILSAFYGWAMREGKADANPVANTNRATAPTSRERVLADAELAAVWKAAGDDDFGRIVRLLIVTGQRRNEVAGMGWNELDLDAALWTIPASRMKNRRPHDVPLSATAVAILSGVPRRVGREFVFGIRGGPFSGFTKRKAALDKQVNGEAGAWTLHDLRRTAATGMATLGTTPHVVEAVLSHVSGFRAGVAGTYNRAAYLPEKRDALDRWAEHICSLAQLGCGNSPQNANANGRNANAAL